MMQVDTLKDTFYSLVAPDLPNEWDVEEAVEKLLRVDIDSCHSILNQVPVIWPVSHSLCFDYLKTVVRALDCIELSSLSEWVNRTLDQYEKNGLRAAQRYMADVEKNFLCPLNGEAGLQLTSVAGRLLPYLRGLSGSNLSLGAAAEVYTDTATIFVPPEISRFRMDSDNFFLYKLIVSYQWAFIDQGSFTVRTPSVRSGEENDPLPDLWLPNFLGSFACPELAGDIYHLLETARITTFLERELPGLMRRSRELHFIHGKSSKTGLRPTGLMGYLQDVVAGFSSPPPPLPGSSSCLTIIQRHRDTACCAADSVRETSVLYPIISGTEPSYRALEPLLHQGVMRLDAVRLARAERLRELKEKFIDGVATRLLTMPSATSGTDSRQANNDAEGTASEKADMAVIVSSSSEPSSQHADRTVVVTVNNEEIKLGDELEDLAADIINELGYLPAQYVSSAAGKAGRGYASFSTSDQAGGQELVAPVTYDEWDYRRGDFRKNWVNVLEKEIPLIHTSFVNATLEKYYGQVVRLRYQFEMMRSAERFVRRQRDGEDIDLDALIDSLADSRAGLAPSDRLFVRLKRDERDIAVLFLVDMSNSTQGWVGEAIKEALVLLCEALDVVGDRYGIYGFSGMRRLRSDFFHIKHLDEQYDDRVRQRIGSIAPREYTRMGPAVRHAISILQGVDSRVRLLITLSDGKPEDYDDYKGEYAIEDTRHALIEAKNAGIHPFCITVDRQAHDYMAHMYGEVNYIMIDNISKLPRKMPEIYRVLTC